MIVHDDHAILRYLIMLLVCYNAGCVFDWAGRIDYPGAPFHKRFFNRYSNSMKISFCSYSCCSEVITMKFCTWHDSCAVVACAKFYSDMIPYNGVTLKPIFPSNLSYDGKSHSWNGPLIKEWLSTSYLLAKLYHGSHRPWKVLEFECCLEKCLIFQSALKMGNFPWKVLENDFMVLKNIGTRKSTPLVCWFAPLNWEK